jgi:hypothetical protein
MSERGHILDERTLALWRLDDRSSTVSDARGVYGGTAAAGCRPVAGVVGWGRKSDLSAGAVATVATDAVFSAAILADCTVELAIWLDGGYAAQGYPLSLRTSNPTYAWGFGLGVNAGRAPYVYWQDGAGAGATRCQFPGALQPERWYHLAVSKTMEAGQARLRGYVDGALVVTSAPQPNVGFPIDRAVLCGDVGGTQPFRGIVDDVRVSSVARSAGEIAESMRRCAPPAPAGRAAPRRHGVNLRVGPDGELDLSGGELNLVDGGEAVAQDVRSACRFFRGEWYAAPERGVPLLEQVFVKNPDLGLVRAAFRDAILARPGVKDVLELELDYGPDDRSLSITFRAETDAGEVAGTLPIEVTT